jgi:hypothetical protein
MSRRKLSVGTAFVKIERIYSGLEQHERRELDEKLLECRWFGCHMKLVMFLPIAELAVLKKKDSHRSRQPSERTRERNDDMLAERESEQPYKSYLKIAKNRDMNEQTVRSGIKEAKKRRETALARKLEEDQIRAAKEKVRAQILGALGKKQ